jgi:hypothetical protein
MGRTPNVGPWTAGQPGMATLAALSCALGLPGLEKCGEAQPGEDVQKLLAVAVPAMLIVLIVLAAPTGAVRRSLGGGGACCQLRRQRQDIRSP